MQMCSLHLHLSRGQGENVTEDFEAVANRLRSVLGLTSDKELAERLGFKYGSFAARKSRGALPHKEIDQLCDAAGLNSEWVFDGTGQPWANGAALAERLGEVRDAAQRAASFAMSADETRLLADLLHAVDVGDRERVLPAVRRLGFAVVPRYDVSAAAGDGYVVWSHNEQVVDTMAFRPEWLREIGVNPNRAAVISVRGDSMEDTLRDGDLILVDTMPVERKVPGIYVILRADSLLVKRLNFKVNGSVEIRSDNKAYPTETLSGAEFDQLKIVGRMVRRVVR